MKKYTNIALFIIPLAFVTGCHIASNIEIYENFKCDKMIIPVNFETLIQNPLSYENKTIEISGTYKWNFEESAIYFGNSTKSKALWIEFDISDLKNTKTGKYLLDDLQGLNKINNKRIKIVGIFTSNWRGHLNQYLGEIHNVCLLTKY